MVERILRILHREWSGLHEAAFLLGGFALLSQILALVRDRILAHQFGAGEVLDVYYAAFRIPDFLYASIASFVAVTVIIPFLLDRMGDGEDHGRAHRFLDSTFTVFFVAMLAVSALLYLFMPQLARFVVPGFTGDTLETYITLSRILLLSPFLLGLSNLFGSITQTFRRFTVFALGPVLYNIGIIVGILYLLPIFGVSGLTYGVLLGALLHVGIQIPVLVRSGFTPKFTSNIDWPGIKHLILLSLPRTLALSSTHLVTMVLVALASHISSGAIAVFTLALNLQSIPLAIVGTSYSVAAFPTLAKLWNAKQHKEFLEHITTPMRHIMFWSFPAIALFIVLRAQIVRTILGSGQFDWVATRLTAAALALFAISVLAQSLQLLFLRAHYAMGETRIPLRNMLIGSVVTLLSVFMLRDLYLAHGTFRYFLQDLLRLGDLDLNPGTEIIILPLAYSIGVIASMFAFIISLRRRFPELLSSVKTSFLHSSTASILMGTVAYHGTQFFDDLFDLNTFIGIFLQGLLSGLLGVLAGLFVLKLMGNQETNEILHSLKRRFWKSQPIASEQENL